MSVKPESDSKLVTIWLDHYLKQSITKSLCEQENSRHVQEPSMLSFLMLRTFIQKKGNVRSIATHAEFNSRTKDGGLIPSSYVGRLTRRRLGAENICSRAYLVQRLRRYTYIGNVLMLRVVSMVKHTRVLPLDYLIPTRLDPIRT